MTTSSHPEKLNIKISPHVQATLGARRPTNWIVAILVMLGLGILVAGGLGALLFEVVFGESKEGSVQSQFSEIFIFGFTALLVYIWVKFKEKRPFKTVGFMGNSGGKKFGTGLLIGLGLITLTTFILVVSGQYQLNGLNPSGVSMGILAVIATLLVVTALQSTSEEILMRGYLIQTLGRQLPAWIAIILPAILFAGVHLGADLIALTNIALIGITLTFITLGQGSIWMVSGIHAAWNFVQTSIFGIPMYSVTPDASILSITHVDGAPNFLTGGDFGVEGSVVVTIIFALTSVATYLYYRKRQVAFSTSQVPQPAQRKA